MPRALSLERTLHDISATDELGAALAAVLEPVARRAPVLVTITGPLGAGKTTLVRAIIRALGFEGVVVSPTYTLHEPYEVAGLEIHHLDLYRLQDAEELEFIGARDIVDRAGLCLVEWPERGTGVLPDPDIEVRIDPAGDHRRVVVAARSNQGEDLVAALS